MWSWRASVSRNCEAADRLAFFDSAFRPARGGTFPQSTQVSAKSYLCPSLGRPFRLRSRRASDGSPVGRVDRSNRPGPPRMRRNRIATEAGGEPLELVGVLSRRALLVRLLVGLNREPEPLGEKDGMQGGRTDLPIDRTGSLQRFHRARGVSLQDAEAPEELETARLPPADRSALPLLRIRAPFRPRLEDRRSSRVCRHGLPCPTPIGVASLSASFFERGEFRGRCNGMHLLACERPQCSRRCKLRCMFVGPRPAGVEQ